MTSLLARLFGWGPKPQTGPTDTDVFRGTRRSITLPPGWECDHGTWRWTEIFRSETDRTIAYGLEVFTRQPYADVELWRPVGEGSPVYGGHVFAPGTEPDMPGSWSQERIYLPMDVAGNVVDLEGQLKTCIRRAS